MTDRYVYLKKENWKKDLSLTLKDIRDIYEKEYSYDNKTAMQFNNIKTLLEQALENQQNNTIIKQINEILQNLGKTQLSTGLTVASASFAKKGSLNGKIKIEEAINGLNSILKSLQELDEEYKKIIDGGNDKGVFLNNKMQRLTNSYNKLYSFLQKNLGAKNINEGIEEEIRSISVILNSLIRGDLNEISTNLAYQSIDQILKSSNLNTMVISELAGSNIQNNIVSKADNIITIDYDGTGKNCITFGVSEKSYIGAKTMRNKTSGKSVATAVPWTRIMENNRMSQNVVGFFSNAIIHNKNKIKANSLIMQYITAKNIQLLLMGEDNGKAEFINLGGEVYWIPELIKRYKEKLIQLKYVLKGKINNDKQSDPEIRNKFVYEQLRKMVIFNASWKTKIERATK